MTAELTLRVASVADLGGDVREITLTDLSGVALPAFAAGAHIRISLPGGGQNAYSLVDLDGTAEAPAAYVLAVRLDPNGKGGSRAMHALVVGQDVTVTAPKNDFPLAGGDAPVLLVAGGIGITPLLSMATALAAGKRDWRLLYAARSADAAAYADHLAAHGDRFTLHLDDAAGGPPNAAAVIASAPPGTHLHVCGPRPMIDAFRHAAEAAGWPGDRIHSELFEDTAHASGDTAFEVEIASTGQVVTIPPDKTIVEALEGAGIDVMYDCQRGDCGICQCDVLEGVPDHRDVVLTEAERAAGKVMQICVSRAKTPRLKLDL